MRGRPPSITAGAILEAAREVFLEQGVGATTAEIARRAGISESVLFHRYKTKEALFMAVMDHAVRVSPVAEDLGKRVGKGEIADHLFEVGTAMVEDVKRTIPLFMVANMMARASTWKLEGLQERMRRPHPAQVRALKLFSGYFEAEMDAGRLRQVDSEILARAFIGAVVQHVMQQFWGGNQDGLPLSTPLFLRGLIDILLNGTAATRRKAR
jgi:AcrR family transcriptional regulator